MWSQSDAFTVFEDIKDRDSTEFNIREVEFRAVLRRNICIPIILLDSSICRFVRAEFR